MATNERTGALTTIGLALAGVLVILSGASIAFAATAGVGGGVSLTPGALAPLALGLVLVASGVETIRRRHFLFALLVPGLLALANAVYVVSSGNAPAVASVVWLLLIVGTVWSQRAAFSDWDESALG